MGKKFVFPFCCGVLGLLWLLIPASGNAHSGFLDANGCHFNKKLGKYECHKGPLAGKVFASEKEALTALDKLKKTQPADKKTLPSAKEAKPDNKK